MEIHLKDGTTADVEIATDLLWDIYRLCEWRRIEVKLIVFRHGERKAIDLLAACDADATFENVICSNFPSLPPDVPLPRDTESDPGDEHYERHQSGVPRSDTMPCRER